MLKKAGSLGLNITSANRIILFDLTWNPVHDQQAVGRAYRLGQKKHVFVYRLATFGTYEQQFFTENIFKLNLSKRVIDKKNPGRFGMSKSLDLSKYFFKPRSEPGNRFDCAPFEGKDQVLDKMITHAANGPPGISKLELTETFHEDEVEEYLTEEQAKLVNEEAEREKVLREEGKYVESSRSYYRSSNSHLAKELFPEDHKIPLDDGNYEKFLRDCSLKDQKLVPNT
jgi:Helicase conserved C-terminal domain